MDIHAISVDFWKSMYGYAMDSRTRVSLLYLSNLAISLRLRIFNFPGF